jgi:biotin-(acetyl-CoA carboxylase) ligase
MGLFGEIVHISTGSEKAEGTAADLDDSGRLLVRLDSGIVRAFEVGEVTLLR